MTAPLSLRAVKFFALPLMGVLASALLLPPSGLAHAMNKGDASWEEELKPYLFEDREILDGSSLIKLAVPERPQDASLAPVSVEALVPQSADSYIKTLTLIVDQNPFPVAAVFHLSPENGLANVATRLRLHKYSDVRAIAETNDGKLYMVSRYVKAVGGCSAPALKDPEQVLAELGRMQLRQLAGQADAVPAIQAKLNIRHPSYSGMQLHFDGSYYIPEYYVKRVEVRQGDRLLVAIDGSIALSEDPVFEFDFLPGTGKDLAIEVVDSKEKTFTGAWPVEHPGAKGT